MAHTVFEAWSSASAFKVPLQRPVFIHSNVSTVYQRADVVSAFALVHWLYSATEEYRNLYAVVAKIVSLANFAAVIQWVDPADVAIRELGHITLNGDSGQGYTKKLFMEAMHSLCVEVIGPSIQSNRPTRETYVCLRAAGIRINASQEAQTNPRVGTPLADIFTCKAADTDPSLHGSYSGVLRSVSGHIDKVFTQDEVDQGSLQVLRIALPS